MLKCSTLIFSTNVWRKHQVGGPQLIPPVLRILRLLALKELITLLLTFLAKFVTFFVKFIFKLLGVVLLLLLFVSDKNILKLNCVLLDFLLNMYINVNLKILVYL